MLTWMPQRHRIATRVTLSAAWLFVALGGAAAIFFTPNTIQVELGTLLTMISGGVVALAGMVAFAGVALNAYRLEWVAAWFCATGLLPYTAALWWIVISQSAYTRATQASFVTAFLLFMVLRGFMCGAHATRLRSLHQREVDGD